MPRRSSHLFDLLAERFAQVVAEHLMPLLAKARGARGPRPATRRIRKLRGRKLDMRCRYAGCKNRSKGPRFSFHCEEHLKLSQAEQKAALEQWAKQKG